MDIYYLLWLLQQNVALKIQKPAQEGQKQAHLQLQILRDKMLYLSSMDIKSVYTLSIADRGYTLQLTDYRSNSK